MNNPYPRHFIGLSLSFCVRQIMEHRIGPDVISAIVTSTAFKSVDEALEHYYEGYWSEYPKDEVRKVLTFIWPLVFQPRLTTPNHVGHNISNGWWVNISTGEQYKTPPDEFMTPTTHIE